MKSKSDRKIASGQFLTEPVKKLGHWTYIVY